MAEFPERQLPMIWSLDSSRGIEDFWFLAAVLKGKVE